MKSGRLGSKLIQLSAKNQHKEDTPKIGRKAENCKEQGGFEVQCRCAKDKFEN